VRVVLVSLLDADWRQGTALKEFVEWEDATSGCVPPAGKEGHT
jgi:hypothetical protein